ncbi:hypothetical protein GCM10007385_32760 [Tateyamaria omphalii]|uniref:hypothetical protein n=1 Tax=Tateyamaria omphalii TaxID=299262 RepID=UPI00167738BF|nr:hypothetical protein [Tateyamaria omphalii]GGX60940.1 hypothetical protein GCM10007385_32760 [Tateyamaria omphalii]
MENLKGIRTIGELVTRIDANDKLAATFGEKPTEVLRAADMEIRENAPSVPNNFVYQAAVVFVGATLLVTVIGAFLLLDSEAITEAPEWVIALTSAGIGALAGMLRA